MIHVPYDSIWKCLKRCEWENHSYQVGQLVQMKKGSQIPHHFECITRALFCEKCNPVADLVYLFNIKRLSIVVACHQCGKIADCIDIPLFQAARDEVDND
jgi:hypothetical protein